MTNYKNLEKTFDLLHDNQPAPFNPSYDPAVVAKCNEYHRLTMEYQNSLPDTMPDEQWNDLVDKHAITLACNMEINGYKWINGYPWHGTEKGQENIKRLFGEESNG